MENLSATNFLPSSGGGGAAGAEIDSFDTHPSGTNMSLLVLLEKKFLLNCVKREILHSKVIIIKDLVNQIKQHQQSNISH